MLIPQHAGGRVSALTWCFALGLALIAADARAIPAFSRQYTVSCATCHAAFPRLNSFGEQFRAANYRLPNWRDTTLDTGDEMLALPKSLPAAIRAQAYVQARTAEEIDPASGPTGNAARSDVQAPYLIKLISSAPLSEHISYYFYGIFAEKGGNGTTLIEDAWFRYDDLFGTKVGMQLGQFQISDLMFPRELRLTFNDYMVYRLAGITYDRGVLFDREFGAANLALGFSNGNGIEQNFAINSPGYLRPDAMFDNDTEKTAFGRAGVKLGGVSAGLFGLHGSQASGSAAPGAFGAQPGARKTTKRVLGLDLSGEAGGKFYWYAQGLWSRWDAFLDADPSRNIRWWGAFAGLDYVRDARWVFSILYNTARAGDFANTGTLFEGIKINSLTLGTSYYFMRNVKGVIELNLDALPKDAAGPPFVGHQTKENYLLLGFDAAF